VEFVHREGDRIPERAEIEAAVSPPGRGRVHVQVHRTRFLLEGLDEELLSSARQVFENFIGDTGIRPEHELTVSLAESSGESFLAFRTTPEPEPYRILVSRYGDDYRFVSYHFAAIYRKAERAVHVALARGPGRRKERLLDNLFRVLAGYAFIEDGAVLVHGAALARGDRGYVFYGPSGSGKTTVSRLSREHADLLSDDQALLSIEGERVLLSATPFRGGERLHPDRHPSALPGPNLNRTVPLAGLYRLVQAKQVGLRDLRGSLGITSLLSAVPVFAGEPYNNERLMDTLGGIAARVLPRELLFLPDSSFWEVVEG
jgi:hypothetical protein